MVRACVLQGYGINADSELVQAFSAVGATAEGVHTGDLLLNPERIADYHILGLPGGFSFGDHLGSGRVMATLLSRGILHELVRYVENGGLILGICNGFQVLVKLGLLPGGDTSGTQGASLIHNTSGRFIDRWVTVRRNEDNHSPWLGSIGRIDVPIRHGEGRFVCDQHTLDRLIENRQIAFSYEGENPNGSLEAIAGITDPTGRVLGLMPHPEAFLSIENHPQWHRGGARKPLGTAILANAVAFAEAPR